MTCEANSVVYLLPDTMGGVASLIGNLLRYRRPDSLQYHVRLTRDLSQAADPIPERLAADSQHSVVFKRAVDNLEKVLRRVHESIPAGEGVVVANDWLGLAALARHDGGRTVLQMLHSDFDSSYQLAMQHDSVVDAYVTHTRLIFEKLQRFLPHRRDTIFLLPYGVPIPPQPRTACNGPLRLLFVGRLVEDKGIHELPAIDQALLARGIRTGWTIVGGGPDGDRVKAHWHDSRVRWTGVLSNVDVLGFYREHDVLVLPTRMEGFPVSLLEAMAAGVVPVVTDLPGGIRQAVQSGVTGYLHSYSDVEGFAASIADLHRDRAKLDRMSRAARQVAEKEFDITQRVCAYQDLYARWRELRRPRPRRWLLSYGSRLDKEWIPNWLVRMVRSTRQNAKAALVNGTGKTLA